VTCPTCGERNPDRARFCLRCGTPLGDGRRRDEERKTVTVLFCDLAGFTARSDLADPEDVKATLRTYHGVIKRVLEGFGGTLDKFVGDGVLGVFGAPTAREDDAERAIRAAFRMQAEIARISDRSAREPLQARIGIDTGDAVVAVGPGPQLGERVTGEVVTLATRIEAAAPVGGIAVGEATRRAAGDLFSYEPLDGAPLEAWIPAEVSRLVREQPNTPFVGRAEEASLLRAAFRRCLGEPSVQLVTVLGDPGVGKSRLIAEFADDLDAQPEIVRWRQGRCLPYGDGVGFWPLSEIVKAEAGILESDGPTETQAKLARSVETAVEDPTERDWMIARLAPLAGVGEVASSGDRSETFTAWRRYFEALAGQHPLVLVFEDLHWADGALLEFVDHVVDWSSGLPMLLLCAARPELYDRRPGWGGGKKNAATIALPPLNDPETAMLISGLLDEAVLPAETQRALLERAGGNPLYTEEFVRMLTDRGILERGGRTLRLADDGEIPVPETVQAIIGARLDALPFETKVVLQDASVLGRVFWLGGVAAIGGRDGADVRSRLHGCAKLELIRPLRSSSIEGDDEFSFWHILVRDVAYGQMPRAERAAKHRAAAAWLTSVAGSRLADQAEVLAHHYGEAYAFAATSGAADAEELRALTVEQLMVAGERAGRLDAVLAERYLRHAVELSHPADERYPRALIQLADIETTTGRFADARDRFDEAIGILRGRDDPVALGAAIAMKTRALHRLGDLREGERLLDGAIALLEDQPPGPELARAYTRMAGHLLMAARFDACKTYAERGLALAERLRLDDEIVRARQNLGAARCELGDAGGLADLWAALRQGLELGIGVGTAVSYGNLAYQLWLLEGPAISLQVWDSAVEFSQVRGFTSEAFWNRCGQVEVLFDLGRWDELLERASEVEAWDREEGGGQLRTFAEFHRAHVLMHRGDVPAAVLLEEEFLPRVRILQRPEFIAPALSIAALLEHRRGHDAMATSLIDEFVAATEDHDGFRLQFLPNVARVLAAHGDVDRLSVLASQETRVRNVRTRIALETAQAILAGARGDHADAAERSAAVAARWLSYGSIPERAQALLEEARARLALGENETADDRLRTARDLAVGLGAQPLVAEIDAMRRERATAAS
jgi:class 3 adenylate cyclase